MSSHPTLRWRRRDDELVVVHASDSLVRPHAHTLARWYNAPHNKALLSNTTDLTEEDVVEQFSSLRAEGMPFLLFRNAELVGDADLRGVEPPCAEFAIMVGERALQGLGLGTAFTIMVHAYAFQVLDLRTVYLTIVPENVAGRRCYEKVGYVEEDTAEARAYADDARDVAMRLDRDVFESRNREALAAISLTPP